MDVNGSSIVVFVERRCWSINCDNKYDRYSTFQYYRVKINGDIFVFSTGATSRLPWIKHISCVYYYSIYRIDVYNLAQTTVDCLSIQARCWCWIVYCRLHSILLTASRKATIFLLILLVVIDPFIPSEYITASYPFQNILRINRINESINPWSSMAWVCFREFETVCSFWCKS